MLSIVNTSGSDYTISVDATKEDVGILSYEVKLKPTDSFASYEPSRE